MAKFLQLNILGRIMMLVALCLVAIGISTYSNISNTRAQRYAENEQLLVAVVTAGYNILDDYGQKAASGKMSQADAQAGAIATLNNMRYGASGYVFVIDGDGVSIVNPASPQTVGTNLSGSVDANGKHFTADMMAAGKANGPGFENYQYPKSANTAPIDKVSYYNYYKPWGWTIGSGVYLDEVAAANQADLMKDLAIGGTIGGILLVAALLLARTITGPIKRMTEVMDAIAGGRHDVEVKGADRKDEIGDMARAVEVFRQNGMRVAEMTDAESARIVHDQQARAEMMGELRDAFGNVVNAAVKGDFSRRIEARFNDAELNAIAGGINELVDTVGRGVGETGEVLAALADTDLTKRMAGDYSGAFLRLKHDTNAVADKLTDIVMQLKGTSGSLKLATGEILSGANDLSERTTKQAATIEETSAAMEQLAGTVMQNAKRASDASEVAATVTRTAEEGGQVMTAANAAMERITASSAKISNIIGLIDDIAFQTNLLALNASVEAARAGEAGKGFAVVAVEVRRLAQSAAVASSEVKALIEQSGTEVTSGSKLVADAATKLSAMLTAARSSNELMSSIAKDSRDQASAIDEVNTAVRQMDEMTQHNAALVEEINAAIEQTEAQATDLDRIVDVFTVDDNGRQVQQAAASRPSGIRAMQDKVKQAAKSYLTRGNTAIKEEWSEF
ncbi:MAG TPA: methyl-accepting chemotaxis protein [Devosiaceae bacterium]|jgi:methyl-accepting chemotaxis protein